jgi:hypothetical protein
MCQVYAMRRQAIELVALKKGKSSTFIQGIKSEACTLASPRQAFS